MREKNGVALEIYMREMSGVALETYTRETLQ